MWRTNGTRSGTWRVKDIHPGSSHPGDLTRVGKRLFFWAVHPTRGTSLWVSNGTRAGTRFLRDLDTGSLSADQWEISAYQGKAYFG
ncbi:MAG: hypothetical protein DRQ55_19265, partial [Planctomycetota bacterium]